MLFFSYILTTFHFDFLILCKKIMWIKKISVPYLIYICQTQFWKLVKKVKIAVLQRKSITTLKNDGMIFTVDQTYETKPVYWSNSTVFVISFGRWFVSHIKKFSFQPPTIFFCGENIYLFLHLFVDTYKCYTNSNSGT